MVEDLVHCFNSMTSMPVSIEVIYHIRPLNLRVVYFHSFKFGTRRQPGIPGSSRYLVLPRYYGQYLY
jgi:hypothetical protein